MTSPRAIACLLVSLALLTLLVSGCRGGGAVIPALPQPGDRAPLTVPEQGFAPIPTGVNTGVMPLARGRLYFDATGAPTLTMLPERQGTALGDLLGLDITRAIRGGFGGGSTLQILSFERRGTNRVAVTVQVTHPFPLPDLGMPASESNRLDLHLFGVHGVLLSSAQGIDPSGGMISGISLDPDLITNAMGYTGLFPPEITGTTTLQHPYRVFFREDPLTDPSNLLTGNFDEVSGYADLVDPRGFNVFPQGSTATTEFVFRVTPGEAQDVDLLIGAHFIDATNDDMLDLLPTDDNGPLYFARAAAGVAPWWVIPQLTLENIAPKESGGEVRINTRLLDWQLGQNADPEYPDPDNLGGIPFASGILQVRAIVPALHPEIVDVSVPSNPGTATGLFDAPLEFDLTIPNTLGPVGGETLGMLIVADEAQAASIAGKRILGDAFSVGSLGTFQVLRVPIPAGTQPPIVELTGEGQVEIGRDISLTARGCDADGSIAEFQWDFDFDGTFTVDLVNAPGETNEVTLTIGAPTACIETTAPVTVAVRALDNDGFFSAIICTDPAEGSEFDPTECTLTGDLPRTCLAIEILPRSAEIRFATELNISGIPSATSPFADTRSAGQHGIVVAPNGREVWVVYHVIKSGFDTGNVFIAKSANSGASFGTPSNLSMITAPTPEKPGDPPPAGEVANNPHIALYADDDGFHPVVVYGRGLFLDQDLIIRASTDGGDSFGPEIRLARFGNQGEPSVAISAANDLYVGFVDWDAPGGDRIMVARGRLNSTELAFSSVNDFASDAGATVRYRTDYLVSQTAPALVVDEGQQQLYVVWSDAARVGNDRARIQADATVLGGMTFGTDVVVGPLPPVGVYQFEPSPALNPLDGRLAVAFRISGLENNQLATDIVSVRAKALGLAGGFETPVRVSDANGTPRIAFAPSLAIAPSGDHFIVWQGAPTGDTKNYDLFFDQSPLGAVFGTDQVTIDDEEEIDGKLRTEQALNPMLATTGCDLYVAWTGPANPADANNTYSIYVDVGS